MTRQSLERSAFPGRAWERKSRHGVTEQLPARRESSRVFSPGAG